MSSWFRCPSCEARRAAPDRLAVAALLDDQDVLGRQVANLGPQRYAARVAWVRTMLHVFAEHGGLAPGLDLDGLAIVLSSATLGLLSASAAFGPLTEQQLAAALDSLTALVERGASGSAPIRDPHALRASLMSIYDQFSAQLAD